jgi:uncharacterized membrane protein (UPF0127 family)
MNLSFPTQIIKMKIQNKTRNKFLCQALKAESFSSRTKGLMFQNPIKKGLLMKFHEETFPGIWMLFMKSPIDLIFLNSNKKVTDIYENIRPINFNPKTWKIFKPSKPSKYILELPPGTLRKTKTRRGDELEF